MKLFSYHGPLEISLITSKVSFTLRPIFKLKGLIVVDNVSAVKNNTKMLEKGKRKKGRTCSIIERTGMQCEGE